MFNLISNDFICEFASIYFLIKRQMSLANMSIGICCMFFLCDFLEWVRWGGYQGGWATTWVTFSTKRSGIFLSICYFILKTFVFLAIQVQSHLIFRRFNHQNKTSFIQSSSHLIFSTPFHSFFFIHCFQLKRKFNYSQTCYLIILETCSRFDASFCPLRTDTERCRPPELSAA